MSSPMHFRFLICALITLSTLLFLAQRVSSQVCVPTPSGLTNWYPAENNANDTVSGANGTFVNGATTDGGYKGRAFSFDGVDDYISLPGTFGGGAQATIEAWVRPTATTVNFQAVVSSTAQQFVHLQLNNSGGNVGVYTNNGAILLPIITQSPVNVWRHIALSIKSGDTRLYINGVLIGSSTQTFATITPTSSLRIGSGFSGSRFFKGLVDEVSLYNRALSAGEIQAIYAASRQGKCTPPPTLTPPANNNFGAAQLISGTAGSLTTNTTGATKEAGEPSHMGNIGGASVWFRWQAPQSGGVTFESDAGSNLLLAAYTGAQVSNLNLVAAGVFTVERRAGFNVTYTRASFRAQAGQTYYLAIDGLNGRPLALLDLDWYMTANDEFANAQLISGSTGSTAAPDRFLTREPGEPSHAGQADAVSGWYRWQAPASGLQNFQTDVSFSPSASRILAVYTGASLNTLTPVVSHVGENGVAGVTFNAVGGTVYYIAKCTLQARVGSDTLSWAPSAPPANDNFSNAELISGPSGSANGSNVQATRQPGERAHAGVSGGRSIWYRWQTPAAGGVSFYSDGFAVAVYTGGSVSTLTPVAAGLNARATFHAVAGTTYYIALEGPNAQVGATSLAWSSATNDDFANAALITGATGSVSTSNLDATPEVGEPTHAGAGVGRSVWYRWQAPASGPQNFNLTASEFPVALALYTGTTLNNLVPVGSSAPTSGTASVKFNAAAGTTYFIAVDSSAQSAGSFSLNWLPATAPVNDRFANAQLIAASSGTVTGTNINASIESGEPQHEGQAGGHSVWYRWQAPITAVVEFNADGFDTLLAVYTGTTVNSLTLIGNDNYSALSSLFSFRAQAGMTYYIAVDGEGGSVGSLILGWTTPALNDNFVNSQLISGSSGRLNNVINRLATREPGEPNHAGSTRGSSVWYRWQAPASGPAIFGTSGTSDLCNRRNSGPDTLLAVYTGAAVNALTLIASNDDRQPGVNLSSRVIFNAVAGTTYYIAVDTVRPEVQRFALDWSIGSRISGIYSAGSSCASRLDGETVTLSGSLLLTTTTDSTGAYSFDNLPLAGNYIVSVAGRESFVFPLFSDIAVANFTEFTGRIFTGNASGRVANQSGGRVFPGVTIALTGNNAKGPVSVTVVTDSDGSYVFDNLQFGGNYTITPQAQTAYALLSFDPPNFQFNNFQSDVLGASFAVTITQELRSISGLVRDGAGVPLSGVTMKLSGGQSAMTQTNSDGLYKFEGLTPNANYTVMPALSGVTFTQPQQTLPNLSVDQKTVDFTALASKANQTITFNPADKTFGDAPFNLSATASSGLPVGFSIVSGPASLSGNTTITVFGTGVVTVRASQAGNANFNAAPDVVRTFTVAKANQTITFNQLPNKTFGDAPFNVSAISSSDLTIVFTILSGPATILGNTITITAAGVVTVRAFQGGNENFNAATPVDRTFTVAKANQTITFNTLANKTSGDAPFNVSASSSSALPISFSILSGPATISGNTITITGLGVVTVRASQPGNANFNAATPVDRSFTVEAGTFQPVVLTTDQVELKTWTFEGRTYAYVKLLFPNAGYRVANFGQPVRAGNDFSADAAVEKFTGASLQAVTTTAQIYDLGPLSNGNYTFAFKNSGTVVKSQIFTVSSVTPPPNPIDNAREFVKQQYRDFLNREADPAGENFWTDNITKCMDPARLPPGQTEAQCTLRQRETTSGAFFQSPEFQYTGYYVLRMYKGALGRQPKLSEFTPDAQFVGAGILVNSQLSGAKINQNKTDFAAQFVNCLDAAKARCAEFKAIYDGLNNQQYVDKLFQTTGVMGVNASSSSDRTALVNALFAGTETRASVLQKVVDGIIVISEGNQQFTTTYGQAFYNAESNRAFVQLQYFGYMKRDPDDLGYAFWLGKLNQFNGNFVNAEMVLAFISSPEYRARFGQP